MEYLVSSFDLQQFKAGNAIKISSKRLNFEGNCIIVVATENELNLAYFDKSRGSMEYQALTVEDIQDGDYEIGFLS